MTDYERFLSHAGLAMKDSAIRRMGTVLAQARDIISFAPGYPEEGLFPWSLLAEIGQDLLSGRDGSVLQYGPTRGFAPLREAVVELMKERGLGSTTDRVVVTTGSQQGLDLVGRVLLDPGEVALMELPSYVGAITAFRNVGASLVGVRQDEQGVDLDHLEATAARLRAEGRRVKFLYLVPNFQNPTGLLLARERRLRVLEWATRHDTLIVEDDPYRDLYFEDAASESDTRPIAADDSEGRVVYLSSFSKIVAPGFRVGWLSAPEALAAKLELAKQAEDLCTGGFDQRAAYEVCRRGLLPRHVPRLRTRYREKRDVMARALRARLGDHLRWADPRGGFFLWVRLTPPLRSESLLEVARQHGVIFVAGGAFFVDGSGADTARLSFSAPSPERIEEGVGRLAMAVEATFAAAAR